MQKKKLQKQMRVGIWLDQERAVIVMLDGKHASVEHIESGAAGHYRHSGGWKAAGTAVAQSVVREQVAERRRDQQLHRFYEEVLGRLSDTSAIAVFGPGEAKSAMAKAIREDKSLAGALRTVEAADKMTEGEFVAKVRAFYGVPSKRRMP